MSCRVSLSHPVLERSNKEETSLRRLYALRARRGPHCNFSPTVLWIFGIWVGENDL